jgi:hypothetical protein
MSKQTTGAVALLILVAAAWLYGADEILQPRQLVDVSPYFTNVMTSKDPNTARARLGIQGTGAGSANNQIFFSPDQFGSDVLTNTIIKPGALVTNISARGLTLPNLAGSRALVTDLGSVVDTSITTALELARLSGVQSPVQGQLDGKMSIYPTITNMTQEATPIPGVAVYVKGYNTANDGGGGVFYYAPASGATIDGGLVFSSVAGGRWLRQYSGAVDVRWFGAAGDDLTDNTTVLQSAYDSVPANSELKFPPGTYRLNSSVTISKPLRITGSGTLKAMAGTFPLNVLGSGSSGTMVSGVRYDSVSTLPTVQPGIQSVLSGLSNIVIRGVQFGRVGLALGDSNMLDTNAENRNLIIESCFFNGDYTGATYGNSTANIIEVGGWNGFRIQNNTFDTIEGERIIKVTGFNRNGVVDGNDIKGTSSSNAQMVDGQSSRSWSLINNKITGSGNWGSVLQCKPGTTAVPSETLEIIVSNNNIDFFSTNAFASGMEVYGAWGLAIGTQPYSSAIMSGNKITVNTPNSRGGPLILRGFTSGTVVGNNCLRSNYLTFSAGMSVENVRVASISGNVIEHGILGIGGRSSNPQGSIYTNSPQAVTITGNTIRDFYHLGAIYLLNCDGLTNVVITGNTLAANGDSGNAALIYVGAPSLIGFDRVETFAGGVVTKIDRLVISGNNGSSDIGSYFLADPSVIIGTKVETGNGWQAPPAAAANTLAIWDASKNLASASSFDITVGGGLAALANVNSTPGTYGDAAHVPVFTVNGKGLITAITSVHSGVEVLNQDAFPALPVRSYLSFVGPGVSAVDQTIKTTITIPGMGILNQSTYPVLNFRPTLNFLGAGVTAVENAGNNRIDITIPGGGGGGEANTGSNLGAGVGVFHSKSLLDLRFNSLIAGAGVTVTSNANAITITATGGGGTRVGVVRELWFTPNQIDIIAGSGAGVARGTYTVPASSQAMTSLDFTDANTTGYIGFFWSPPDSWNAGAVKMRIYWTATAGTVGDGVVWAYTATAQGDGDTIAVTSGATTTDTYQGADKLHISPTIALTPSNTPLVGDMLSIRVTRVGSNGADVLTGDAKVLGIKIQYTETSVEPVPWP